MLMADTGSRALAFVAAVLRSAGLGPQTCPTLVGCLLQAAETGRGIEKRLYPLSACHDLAVSEIQFTDILRT